MRTFKATSLSDGTILGSNANAAMRGNPTPGGNSTPDYQKGTWHTFVVNNYPNVGPTLNSNGGGKKSKDGKCTIYPMLPFVGDAVNEIFNYAVKNQNGYSIQPAPAGFSGLSNNVICNSSEIGMILLNLNYNPNMVGKLVNAPADFLMFPGIGYIFSPDCSCNVVSDAPTAQNTGCNVPCDCQEQTGTETYFINEACSGPDCVPITLTEVSTECDSTDTGSKIIGATPGKMPCDPIKAALVGSGKFPGLQGLSNATTETFTDTATKSATPAKSGMPSWLGWALLAGGLGIIGGKMIKSK